MTIDTIKTSHHSEIQCIDVSQVCKDIVSYSSLILEGRGEIEKTLIVHGLEDQSYLNGIDAKITEEMPHKSFPIAARQKLKWVEYWKCDPKLLMINSWLNTITFSPQGDALVLCGNEFLSIWVKDANMSSHSFSQDVYYAKSLPPNLYAHCIEEKDIGQIIQCQFTSDSRAIITLEEDNLTKLKTVKMWYNETMAYLKVPEIKKQFISKQLKMQDDIQFLPNSKNIDKLEFITIMESKKVRSIQPIIFPETMHESDNILPICILIITIDGKIQLWMEDLTSLQMEEEEEEEEEPQFPICMNCVYTISHKITPNSNFDVTWLNQNISENSANISQRNVDQSSCILDPLSDKTQICKVDQQSKLFGNMISENYNGKVTQDYFTVLAKNCVNIYSIIGLRNFPSRQVEVQNVFQINLNISIQDVVMVSNNCFQSGCDLLNDIILLTGSTPQGELIQMKSDLSKQSPQWKYTQQKSMIICKQQINQICEHQNLPLIAIIQDNSTIMIYESQNKIESLQSEMMQFLSKYQSESAIKHAKWVPQIGQLVVLSQDRKLKLISTNSLNQLLFQTSQQKSFEDLKPIQSLDFKDLCDLEIEDMPIDFEVYEIQLMEKINDCFEYQLKVAFVYDDKIVVSEYVVSLNLINNKITSTMKTVKTLCFRGNKIEALMCSSIINSQTQPYQDPNSILKMILKTNNQEIKYIQIQNNEIEDKWQKKVSQPNFQCDIGSQHIGIFVYNVGKKLYHMYIYDHCMDKYVGFIDLLNYITFDPHDSTVLLKSGFPINVSLQDNLIAISCLDNVLILGWDGLMYSKIGQNDQISGVDIRIIESSWIYLCKDNKMIICYNNKHLFLQKPFINEIETNQIQPINQLLNSLTSSQSIHSVAILQDLFIDGKIEFIMKILIQLNTAIATKIKDIELVKQNQDSFRDEIDEKIIISPFANYQLNNLLDEINSVIDLAQTPIIEEKAAPPNQEKKRDKAIDDFFGGEDSDDDDDFDLMDFDKPPPQKKEKIEEKAVSAYSTDKKVEQKFLECCDELLLNILKSINDRPLVDFILVFKNIYSKDFSQDEMAGTLLRQLYLETEEADQNVLKGIQEQSGVNDEEGTQIVKKLANHEIYAQMYNEDKDEFATQGYQASEVNMSLLQTWDSRKTALALYTINQDGIIDELKTRFNLENNASWSLVRKLCMPVWVKDSYKLRLVVEWIAKVSYRLISEQIMSSAGDGKVPVSKAEATSLWYILLNKKSALISLYEKEKGMGGDKVAQMLSQDFSTERWRKASLKNAMVLRQKQRYLLCTSFFILGGDIQSALQVMKSTMEDPLLAILTCRMLLLQHHDDPKIQKMLDQIYDEYFIKRGQDFDDNYLESLGFWGKKQYIQAVNALQKKQNIEKQGIDHIFQVESKFEIQEQQKVTKEDILPILTNNSGFELQRVIHKLQKTPRVVDALKNKNQATMEDMFDDFGATAKVQEVVKEEKVEIDIDNSMLLQQLLRDSVQKKNMVHCLFLIRENQEHINENNQILIKNICIQILNDQIMQTKYDSSYLFQEESSLQVQIQQLLEFTLGKKQEIKQAFQREMQQRVIQTLKSLQVSGQEQENTMFIHEIELRLDSRKYINNDNDTGVVIPQHFCSHQNILKRLEEQTISIIDVLKSVFNNSDILLDTKNNQQQLSHKIRLLSDIEQIVQCLIIYDHFQDTQNQKQIIDLDEINYFCNSKVEDVVQKQPEKAKPKFDPFDDMMGGDSSSDGGDLMDFDNPAPPKKPTQKNVANLNGYHDVKTGAQTLNKRQIQSNQLLNEIQKFQIILYKLHSKLKCSLVLYSCLLLIAIQTNKFTVGKQLLQHENLQSIFSVDYKAIEEMVVKVKNCEHMVKLLLAVESQEDNTYKQLSQMINKNIIEIEELSSEIHYQHIKTYIQKLKASFEQQVENEQKVVKWEVDIYDALESTEVYLKFPDDQVNEDHLQLGLLFKMGYIRPEIYEFMNMWLKFALVNKMKTQLEKQLKPELEVFQQKANLMFSPIKGNMIPFGQEQNISGHNQMNIITQLYSIYQSQQFDPESILDGIKALSKQLEEECTIFYQDKLQILQRKFISLIHSTNKEDLYPLVLKYFFKTPEKAESYYQEIVGEQMLKKLNDQYLSLIGNGYTTLQDEFEITDKVQNYKINSFEFKSLLEIYNEEVQTQEESQAPSTNIVKDLYWTGIELFKQKSEQISDFAFDNSSHSNNAVIGLMTSGCREIPIINTLLFRNRIDNGHQLIDEENLTWEECLHRYTELENIMYGQHPGQEIIESKDQPIISTIDSMFAHKTINYRSKPLARKNLQLVDQFVEPWKKWNGSQSQNYMNTSSRLDITHEDYTFAVDSHPHLPIYTTGNRRGIICSWKFNQHQDKSLNQYMPEVDPRQADAKKACVKKIMFNNYGDKIMSINMEGSFSTYQVDCQTRQMHKIPIFSLYENIDSKINDFDLVNSDNVICTLSQKNKVVKLYDMLLPYSMGNQSQVMDIKLKDSNSCGNLMLFNKSRQSIYTFNGRQGTMTELDLRKNGQMVNQYQLSKNEEISAVCLSQNGDTLITGYKDGNIKIHSVDKYYDENSMKTLQLREQIEAFPLNNGKRAPVQKIRINSKNGGVYACSQSGILKLIRPKI